ncbi:hypothetical protein [Winogradskyella sp.]|uniref:hypothetical protein n=1 Tax=Winogradskyella sp. TaxID=1883156 RepID=UPI0025DAD6B6|nr:hypothetical protein [Winogradskyella sp.]
MLKKIIFAISFILISLFATAQKNINHYKYIIIPSSFDFTKGKDQYQLNSLTKFLFNKYGYEAYFVDDNLPDDLKNQRCLALTSEVSNEKSGIFKTKLEIILKDCYGAVVMTSEIGDSKLKKYDRAFNEALREAFETFKNLDYKYVPSEEVIEVSKPSIEAKLAKTQEIEKPKETIEKNEVKEEEIKVEPIPIDESNENLYYAQVISNGFQLVNSEPRIVMILLTTAAENVFIVKDRSAIVFKEDGFWFYSENDGKLGEKTMLNIKF